MNKSEFYDFLGIKDMYSDEKYMQICRIAILSQKEEYEKNLNNMWKIYQAGVVMQIGEYKKQLQKIKSTGLKVLRNSAGNHKIVSG